MTTYNWYFSQAGHDAYGNGSIGNPWKSLSKAQNQINTANTEDVVNLFFKRGDTWRVNSSAIGTTGCYGIRVTTNHPKVNINAYNNGTLPIFDGEVTDFSSVPVHSLSGPTRWNRLFEFSRSGSIQNVHIQNVYGHGIYFPTGITNFTLNSTIINDFGRCGIIASYGASNFLIERNVIYNGEMLYLNGKQGTSGAWAGAIDIQCGDSPVDPYVNNKIRYNVVYDIYGEGINYMVGGSLVEYNIVGDTGSVAMFPQTRAHIESGTGITRYNYIIHSNTDNIAPTGEGSIGIRFMDNDFQNTGDNSNLHIEIYGNIIINRSNGIQVHLFASEAGNESTNLASLKIYNNTMIDCDASLVISQPDEVNVAYVYNNSSIHYNKTCPHVVNWDLGTGYGAWDISHNHFYPVDSVNTVLPIFNNNAIIADPKLTNAHQIDFTGQSGPTYFKDIKFSDLYPMADSPLIGSGKPLDESFDNIFLTQGTDFSTLPNVPKFSLAMQTEVGNWDLGAIISSGLDLCAGVVCDNICIGNDLWSQKCVSGACFLDQLIEQNSSTCGPDPCAGVVCDNICQGNDLWSQKCVNGACFLDQLIEQNSSTCGPNPCAGVVCDNICQGNDLWSQKCVNGSCFLDQLVQQNSSTCGPDPCAGVVCDNICQGNDLWSQKCVNGACFLDQLIEQNSVTCDLGPCENVFCHNTCVGYDLWSQICDPETGVCKVDQLLESNSATCMVTDYIPTDESTIKLYLVMGGLAFAGLGMVLLAKNK